jgi:hypothetical protein
MGLRVHRRPPPSREVHREWLPTWLPELQPWLTGWCAPRHPSGRGVRNLGSLRGVRMQFSPDDEDAFYAARDELVSRFERTPGGGDLGWVAAQVLDFKWGYLDGDLSQWRMREVEEILFGLYPAKVMLDVDDLDLVLEGFARFLAFLGDAGIMPEDAAARLATSVTRLASQFRDTALDERNWSTGKRLWSVAQYEGVDPTDPAEVQRFIEDFNRRPIAERDADLGGLPPDHLPALGPDLIGPLPPIVLPPTEELESAARQAFWFTRLQRLVRYVGEGRPLTERGNLTLADGKALVDLLETDDRFDEKIGGRVFKTQSSADLSGVDLTLQMAVESQLLTRSGRKLLLGTNSESVDDPLAALYGAWLVLLTTIGPTQHWYRRHRYNWDWYAEELDASLPMILLDLYRNGVLPIEEVTDDTWAHLETVFDLDDVPSDNLAFHRQSVESSLRRAFDLFAELGMVRVADVTETTTEYGGRELSGGTVELTPLGKWAVQRIASRVTSAPVVGELRSLSAAELLAVASDIPEVEARAEIDAWIDHRGEGAAQELVEALRTADETGRGLGFRALIRIGPDAGPAVNRFADDPELAPYVTVWRIDTLDGTGDDMDCTGDPERFLRLLGAVVELWGPAAAISGWAGPAAGADGLQSMLDESWRVKRPETEQVLAAIGSGHPDKLIAKAARKALFKHRTAD